MNKYPIYQMLHGEIMFRHRRTSGSNLVTSQCRTSSPVSAEPPAFHDSLKISLNHSVQEETPWKKCHSYWLRSHTKTIFCGFPSMDSFYQEILWSCSSNMVMPDVLSVVILSRNAAATLTRCTATGRAGDRRIHRSPHHEQPKALDVNNIPLQNQSTVSNGMRFPKPKLQSGKES